MSALVIVIIVVVVVAVIGLALSVRIVKQYEQGCSSGSDAWWGCDSRG
jgi:regulator of protease activity HflC (stomatin/prohibitin superfamily)